VLKPLYSIVEAGMYWWVTYLKHYREKLSMDSLTYDPCLLILTNKEKFSIVTIQTDDTLGLLDLRFAALKDKELRVAKFIVKPKEILGNKNVL